jgi:type I restriction enzyme S subunit
MKSWKEFKLNELGKVNRGKSKHRPRNEPSLFNGKYPFVQTGDIKAANFYVKDYSQTYSEKGLAQSKLWKKDTLCITIAANIAETAVLGIEACFPDSIIGFVADESKSDVKFIKYHFDLLKIHLQSISQGTTQDNLSQEKLLKFNFTVPIDVKEQKQIASIIYAYDNLIEINNQRIKLLEQTARELYKEWFVRMRFPDYKKTKFKKGIPDKWGIEKVKSIVNRHKFGRTYRPEELIETGNVIVIDQSTKALLGYHNNEPDHKASSGKPMIIFGDHTCKMQLMVEDFSLAENVIPVSSKNNIPIYFLYYLIESLVETTEYKRHWNDLVTKSVLIPIDDLQKRYSDIVKPFFEQINILIKQNTELRKIRDRLLPRLISGKLQVKADSKRQNSVMA